jgi:hypothetical protein
VQPTHQLDDDMIDDLDVRHAARLLVEQRGTEAVSYAKEWIRALDEVGNTDGARTLAHIIQAIDKLGARRAAGRKRSRRSRKAAKLT